MAYPIDQSYRDSVRALFQSPQHTLPADHAVLTLLDNLHDYTFDAIVKAYDFYTLGSLRRFSAVFDQHPALKTLLIEHLGASISKLKIDALYRKPIQESFDALEQYQGATQVQLVFNLLVTFQIAGISIVNSFSDYLNPPQSDKNANDTKSNVKNKNTNPLAKALTTAMRGHLSATDLPLEIWYGVAYICDELEKADNLQITLHDCFSALVAWHLDPKDMAKVNSMFSKEDRLPLEAAYEISLRATELEAMQLDNSNSKLFQLFRYRNPLENFAINVSMMAPNLAARMAVAALFFKLYYQAINGNRDFDYKSDFANWLLHRMWRSNDYHVSNKQRQDKFAPYKEMTNGAYECISTSSINDHETQKIYYTELEVIMTGNASIFNADIYQYLKNNASFTTEYKSADSWAGSIGRHGAHATNTIEIERIGCTMFVRYVWEHLLNNPSPQIHNASVIAAASKLAIACLKNSNKPTLRKNVILKETTGREFWCQWVPDPATYVRWIARFEDGVKGKQVRKHAMTDQICTIGQLVQCVTGEVDDINSMLLIQMARSVYFSDVTRHEKKYLLENDRDLYDEALWIAPWNDLASDSHLALSRPGGLPHHWLYGKAFFIEVEKAIRDVAAANNIQAYDGLIQKSAKWVRHLLCIPWCDERKIIKQHHQLRDRPSQPDMFKAIQSVFIIAQYDRSCAKSFEVSSALAPICAANASTPLSAYFQRLASTT